MDPLGGSVMWENIFLNQHIWGLVAMDDKMSSAVLFSFHNCFPGSNTQSLLSQALKHSRQAGRKPSNADQTGHVNGDSHQQSLFELPHKQTINELVRVCRPHTQLPLARCWKPKSMLVFSGGGALNLCSRSRW